MPGWCVVLLKTAAMFLVILVGWVARRRKALSAETTSTLSRFVVDITFPALVFMQMLKTVDAQVLREGWYLPLICMAILVIGEIVGLFTAPLFARKEQRRTFVFLISISNWVYLPLPIAQALYDDAGVRTILLYNVGAQLVLWSMGVWTLRGGKPDREALLNLLKNPGLLATGIGILVALYIPESRVLAKQDPGAGAGVLAYTARALFEGLELTGNLTIALSLIVIGGQLGGLDVSSRSDTKAVVGVLITRLVLTSFVTIGVVQLLKAGGVEIPEMPRMLGYVVAFMPVAVSCSIFTERFGGDTSLAARSIFYSTLISIGSVPLLFYLVQQMKL